MAISTWLVPRYSLRMLTQVTAHLTRNRGAPVSKLLPANLFELCRGSPKSTDKVEMCQKNFNGTKI